MSPSAGNQKSNPWTVPYFHLPDQEEDLEFRRYLQINDDRLRYLNTPRPNQRRQPSPLRSLGYYRVMAEDAGKDADEAVAAALAERANAKERLGPNLHPDANLAFYENRKDGKGEPRGHTQWNLKLFRIGFNLSDLELDAIEELIADHLFEDGLFCRPFSQFATTIKFHGIECTVKRQFGKILNKQGIPPWWFDFAIRGWVRHVALWMRKSGEGLQDKLQRKKMIVLRGGKKGFLREKPTVAVKRKYKPRAAAVSKSYVEEATDSDEPTDDNVLPPAKRAKTVPFTIQMGDEDDEIEPLPATSLPPTSDTNTTAPLDQTALSDEANRQNIEQVMDSETRDKTSGATRSATPPLANSMQASQTPTTTPPPEKASKVPKKPRGRPPKSEKPAKPSKQPTTRKPRVPKAPKVPKVPKTKTPPPQATTATHLLKNSQLLITVRHKPRLGDVISLLSLLDPEKQAEATGDVGINIKDLRWNSLKNELKEGGLIESENEEELVWVVEGLDFVIGSDRQLGNAVRGLRERTSGGLLRMEIAKKEEKEDEMDKAEKTQDKNPVSNAESPAPNQPES